MQAASFDPQQLVQRFRPFYRLHSEEMWYPCHPEDQLRCADLVSVVDGSVVIPALGAREGSAADQMLCTPLGLQQLADRGIRPDQAVLDELRWAPAGPSGYGSLLPSSSLLLRRADDGFMAPYGWIDSTNFDPPASTWFHCGAPNNPLGWLGGDPTAYAPPIISPPAGVSRGAWQEPVTSAWVQRHTVAGVSYIDIIYTAFLGWNGSISMLAGQGEHPNDVETIIVRLRGEDLDNPVQYYFQQHGGFAWYDASFVEHRGDRVVVYFARQSHECYPHPGRYGRLFGAADDLCDSAGVTWDAPVLYTFRPQGIDKRGVDSDALRCSIAPGDPNSVILIPLDDPGPLWQYVRFQFLARRPATVPLIDDDFTHSPFPLATSKWWPGEGPAGTGPPLSAKAAEPSAAGIPPSFYDSVAEYLGPDPMPVCSATNEPSARNEFEQASPNVFQEYRTAQPETISGSGIGGQAAEMAPNAPFVDWRGGIGVYILGALTASMQNFLKGLPDPLVLGNIVAGTVTIEDMFIKGFRSLTVKPLAASSATSVAIIANVLGLNCTATVSFQGGQQNIPVSAAIGQTSIISSLVLITPVAIPAASPDQWYVPYVGPLPYSYDTAPFSTTGGISSGSISLPILTIGDMTVDVGNPAEDAVIDLILAALKQTIEKEAAVALQQAVNNLIGSIFDGTMRVA